jgi:uncharacterized protein involved in exopolysaccharide biosynthesis
MSLIQFLRILVARRWIIVISLITCVVVAVVVASTLPERYTARARVLLDIIKPDPVTGQMIAGNNSRVYIRTQIELIQDYRVAGDVVDKLGWLQNPTLIAQWQAETGGVGDMRRWGAQRIIDATEAGLVEGSNILEIIYSSPDPEVSKAVVSALREAYIDASLRFRTDSAGRSADWYLEQADRAQKALAQAEATKAKFERDNGLVVNGGVEAESSKLAGLQAALVSLQGNATASQYMPPSSAVVDQLKLQVTTLNDQIEQAGERLGTEHPTYKALVARRNLVQKQLAQESAQARAVVSAISGATRQTVGELQSQYEAQKAKVLGMKDQLNQLAQLQREIDQRRAAYDKAAARTADLKLESSISESGLVILGDSMVERKPSFPNWPQIVGLSLAFGLALGIALAILTELLARRVRGPEDLSFAAKAPVLAVIADVTPPRWRLWLKKVLSRKPPADLQPAE